MESFSETKQWQRIIAGFGGGMFNNPPPVPVRTIVNGWPQETLSKLGMQTPQQPNIIDGWNARRNK